MRMLKWGEPITPQSRNHSAKYISVPRAAEMSPTSTMLSRFQPKLSEMNCVSFALAATSLPQMNHG